jgi:hypothetical protein
MDYTRKTFAEIEHLLPRDGWAAWRNQIHAGEFKAESVLVFDGPATLDSLSLDAPFGETEPVFLILVQGDLTVEKYIYNEDTDGATGLTVLGNLRVGTMLVGGQEIYVTGNLVVDEVFWGEYNHGDLRVLGDAAARVFVETDEYSVTITGEAAFGHRLNQYDDESGGWTGLNAQLMHELFVDDFIFIDEEEGETMLVRDKTILAQLQAGQPLLKNRPGSH